MEDDAFDYGFAYYNVRIMRDISVESDIVLVKNDTFQQVNFHLVMASFAFIDWQSAQSNDPIIRPKRMISITQEKLAPLCRW